MQGLLVLGAGHGAQEAAVAAALAETSPGMTVLDLVPASGSAASLLTAARHTGTSIDPGELVAYARAADGPVLASAGGGLLAPLTARYAVRDLAVELGLPLVLAVPAGPDLLGLARLSLEAARSAGLVVEAIVLTAWPDPPGRVLLDERRLLETLGGVALHALPQDPAAHGEAARAWAAAESSASDPAGGELAAPGPSPAAATPSAFVSTRAPLVLDPYTAWTPRAIGDPRTTPRPALMAALLDIIAAEGPMVAARAYALANRAGGGKKLTNVVRAPLSSAVHWLAQEGKVVLRSAEEVPWQRDDLLRLPDSPAVRVRGLGPRALEEVPLDEVAELMRRLRVARGVTGSAALKRAVLGAYELVRLTTRADEYLELALDLAE